MVRRVLMDLRRSGKVTCLGRLRRKKGNTPNGLAEAFVGTFKRDYVNGAELRDAETVLPQLGG